MCRGFRSPNGYNSFELRTEGGRPGLVGWWTFTDFHEGPSGPNAEQRHTGPSCSAGAWTGMATAAPTIRRASWPSTLSPGPGIDPADQGTIEGGCVHPITSGTGSFAGASGLLTMRDFYDEAGQVRTTYRGTVTLRGRRRGRCDGAGGRRRGWHGSGR